MANADWGGHAGSRLGLDIGGTLAKLVVFESEARPSWCNGRLAEAVRSLGVGGGGSGPGRPSWVELDDELSFADEQLGGRFRFVSFRSDDMAKFVDLLEAHELHLGVTEILATGGGAYKYAPLFKQRLGVDLKPVDELGVVVQGIAWLVDRPIRERFGFLDSPGAFSPEGGRSSSSSSPSTVSTTDGSTAENAWSPRRKCLEMGAAALFPFLLVNIGSGVSVVRVDGLDRFERVSGSAIGGGTFWGLCQLLCPDCTAFGEAGRLAEQGDASSVNLLVEDIYGGDYVLPNGTKLPGSITASFFAKAASGTSGGEGGGGDGERQCTDAAILHALVKMVSSNICQIAYLNARLHGVQRIVFTGNFLRQNPVAREAISENMRRVSAAHPNGEEPFRALFLQHEGYFGALGTFLHNVKESRIDGILPTPRVPSVRHMGPIGTAAGTAAYGSEADAAEAKPSAVRWKSSSSSSSFRAMLKRASSHGLPRPPTAAQLPSLLIGVRCGAQRSRAAGYGGKAAPEGAPKAEEGGSSGSEAIAVEEEACEEDVVYSI